MFDFLAELRAVEALLAHDTPETDDDSGKSREESSVVGGLVATQTVGTVPISVVTDHGVSVEDAAVEQVEDVTAENGGKGHDAPVLGEATNAERVCDERWEHAEQKAVGNAGEAGDNHELVRVGYCRPGKLRQSEHDG